MNSRLMHFFSMFQILSFFEWIIYWWFFFNQMKMESTDLIWLMNYFKRKYQPQIYPTFSSRMVSNDIQMNKIRKIILDPFTGGYCICICVKINSLIKFAQLSTKFFFWVSFWKHRMNQIIIVILFHYCKWLIYEDFCF